MATIHKALMALAIALALGLVVTAGASPALAKGRAQASYNGGGYPITAARAPRFAHAPREKPSIRIIFGV